MLKINIKIYKNVENRGVAPPKLYGGKDAVSPGDASDIN